MPSICVTDDDHLLTLRANKGVVVGQQEDHDRQSAAYRWLASEIPIEQVPVASLQRGDSPRLNCDSKPCAAWLRGGADIPPIIVHRPTMGVIDGARRVAVARQRDQGTIAVRFFDGTADEAFVLGVVANNGTQGQPLTPNDRKAAATRILGMYPGWSDRMIAVIAGLSHPTVGTIRRNLSTGNTFQLTCRLGKDGRTRPTASRASHKAAAAAAFHADEIEALHWVGGQANRPAGAVNDLRARLKQGIQPSVARTYAAGVDVFIARGQVVVQKLHDNPSVWITDKGKALVRLLLHSMQLVGMVQAASRATPEHCRGLIAEAASLLSDAWSRLAQELRPQNRIG